MTIAGTFPHRDHTDAFRNEVDKILGDWRERKEWLRRYGAALDVSAHVMH
ncbi:MAG: hypothetical protein ACOCYN_02945 [Planctomycetota bacterium]